MPSLPALSGLLQHAFRDEGAVVSPCQGNDRASQSGSWNFIHVVPAPLSSSPPPAACVRSETRRKVSSKGRSRLGASREEGTQPACSWWWAAPPPHTHFQNHPNRTTPLPLCLRQQTGTKVLRKDKGGGREGRWPGFSPCHKGQLAQGGENWRQSTHSSIVPVSQRSWQLQGEVSLGPAGSPSLPARWAGGGSTGENNLSFAVCGALPQPTVDSSICQEKDLLNASPI